MTKITKDNWMCIICSSASHDSDEFGKTLEDHIKRQHGIDKKTYDRFVAEGIGASKLKVKMLNYPNDIKLAMISFLSQTWGPTFNLEKYSDEEVNNMIKIALKGKTLSTVFESLNFTFQIDGLSRASSHQLVRVRIGSGFSQKGMSDAYYGDTDYIIPASIVAAGKLEEYKKAMEETRKVYIDLFKSGVAYQDARFILPHCVTTSVVWTVNFLALKNFCNKRMMRNQSWEMNALCELIKFEMEKVYPELAEILVPACDYSKKCNSFGNLFEGCGKYPLEKQHDRYVFESAQIARNIKFNDEYVEKTINHNKSVKPVNNHFLLLAQEKENIDNEFYGKYAHEIYDELKKSNKSKQVSIDSGLKNIITTFNQLYSYFEQYETTNDSTKFHNYATAEKLEDFKDTIMSVTLLIFNKNRDEVISEIWHVHQVKNKKYNDGWYYDGIRGILKDLHRKVQRLKTGLENNQLSCYQETDLYDTLLYVVFLIVGLQSKLPLKGVQNVDC